MTFEAVCTGDWHLAGLAKHFIDHLDRQMFEVDKMYQYAINNGINHVVVCGDISDTPNMPEAAYIALINHLKKYDGHINTYYIAGNHDFSDINKTSMDLLNVLYKKGFFKTFHLFLKPEERIIDGVPINFLPYPCLRAPKSDVPHLNFSHIEYNGCIGDNGRPLKTTREFKQNKGDFNVSGHVHQYQYIKSKRAIFTGNPYQKNFGESLPKGFVHIKARATKEQIEFRHKFIDIKPDFQFINLRIETRRDFGKLQASDSFRYKLWIAPGVEVPKDLRIKFPNITGGVFDLDTKGKKDTLAIADNPAVTIRHTKQQLSTFLKAQGFDKRFRTEAYAESLKAANELGISL